MIKMKAPIDVPDKFGNTPLALAFLCGHSNFCTMLIDNKADVNRLATIIDYEKYRQEEKKKRRERIQKGEAIEQENDEFLTDTEEEQDQQGDQIDDEVDNRLYGGARTKQTARKSTFGGKAPLKTLSYLQNQQLYQNQNQYQQQQNIQKKTQIKIYLLQSTKFPVGSYSYFKLAIKQGWQGVAYLLISDGYELQRAIEDAIMEEQFKLVRTLLMKVKDDKIVQKKNENKQNLFHIFSIKGKKCTEDIAQMIAEELASRQVDRNAKDYMNNTPLHYATNYGFFGMINYLLKSNSDPNAYNNAKNTPFSIRLQGAYNALVSETELQLWKSKQANFNINFKVKDKNYFTYPLLYLIQELHLEDEIILDKFTQAGCNINGKTESGETSLMLAIKINSMRLVNFILHHPQFDKAIHSQDSQNRTPIHYVVQPLKFGSYENIRMLEVLAKQFDINQPDESGKTPLDYANEQDSGTMAAALKKLNAQAGQKQKQARLPTSVISQAQWVEEEIDVEANAQKFLDQNGEQLDDQAQDKRKIVDPDAHQSGKVEVWIDKESGPYSLLMTKVDIGNGIYSENVFYKMQVLHEINRNVFILFTKWGRIGTNGQFQLTPFENAEEAIKEFNKIFHTKAGGNDWRKVQTGEEPFVKKPGKYQLMNFKNVKNFKTLLTPFDFSKKSPYQQSNLDKAIKRFMLQFIQVKLYNQDLEQFRVDLDSLPIERLDRKQLEVAKAILNELTDCVHDLQDLRKRGDIDIKKIQNIFTEISDKSSRFYELVPTKEQKTEPIPPLDSIDAINQKLLLIETLLNFEITSKILLGAHLMKQTINPLTYCFNALNVRVVTLPKEHPEFQLIMQYINSTSKAKVSNIFALERRGEAERFEHNKQYKRMLLWHGSKISNFMGILAQGLKVAPPWAFNTGSMFGKGIYFADTFQKSYGYTEDWSLYYNRYNGLLSVSGQRRYGNNLKDEQDEIQRYRYMLLCEVAVGKSKHLYNAQYITNLDKKYQSVKGCGRTGPDYKQSVVLANGCKVPVGQSINYPQPKQKDTNGVLVRYNLQNNEYIVYDETKVRVRYMVQLDTKDTIDEL